MLLQLSSDGLDQAQSHICIGTGIIGCLAYRHLGHANHLATRANQFTNWCHDITETLKYLILEAESTSAGICQIGAEHSIESQTMQVQAMTRKNCQIIFGIMHILVDDLILQQWLELLHHIRQR